MTSRPQNLAAPQLASYRKPDGGTQPDYLYPPYVSTVKRSPREPLVRVPMSLSELTGPIFGPELIGSDVNDLTRQGVADPIGVRIVVRGCVLDANARPIAHTLVEVWQANAAGRYRHRNDQHDAPLDPNFSGGGRTLTGPDGAYRFVTIRPGAYPWKNAPNAWRPAHIHFSVFGRSFAERLVTQMYFPGDPLFPYDPILQSVRDERARARLVASFDLELTEPEWALGYRFDIVVGGHLATPRDATGATTA